MRSIFVFLSIFFSQQITAQVVFDSTYHGALYQRFGRNIEPANNGYMVSAFVDNAYSNTALYRLTNTGDTLWTITYGDDTVQYKTYEMQRCSDGGYLLCGDYQRLSTSPNMDSYLMKVDSLGNVVWFNKYGIPYEIGGGKDYANNVVELSNGNILTIGHAKHSYTEIGTIQNYSLFQGYVHLFDSIGDSLRAISVVHYFDSSWQTWSHVYSCNDVATSGNKICIVGRRSEYLVTLPTADSYALLIDENLDTIANILFPVGTNMYSVEATASGTFLIFGKNLLTEIDTAGTILWQQQISFSPYRYTKVGARQNGEIVLLESADGGDIACTVANSNVAGGQGTVILHTLNSIGVEICIDTISHWPALARGCVDFLLEGDSLITLTGGNGLQSVWVVQYSGRCHSFVGIEEIVQPNELSLFPNPTYDNVTMSGLHSGDVLSIWSSSGQLVYEYAAQSEQDHIVNFDCFSSGLYTVICTSREGIISSTRLIRE